MKNAKNRVTMLDILRGGALIGMICHHTLVSYEIVFNATVNFLYTKAFQIIQLIFVVVFLLISGICTQYSKNILKRGSIVFAAAMLMTFATCCILPQFGIIGLNIYFGILHMFGLSMLLYHFGRRFFSKIPAPVGIIVFSLLFVIYYIYYSTNPTSDSWILMVFGILPNSIESYGDYYPLLPYFFAFLTGTYIGGYVKDNKFPYWFYNIRVPFLEFCGRNSLWIYVLHQPIIFPIMLALSYIIK